MQERVSDSKTSADIEELLDQCKDLIMKLEIPSNEKGKMLKEAIKNFGIPEYEVESKAWPTAKKVFASKYNERACIATRKIGITLKNIRMAVLIQKVCIVLLINYSR